MSGKVGSVLVALGVLVGGGTAAVEPRLEPQLEFSSGAFAGYWRGHVAECGVFTLSVAEVQQDGAVVGAVDCPALGLVRAIGRAAVRGRQLRGWIEGRTLRLEGEFSTAQVTLDAGRLVGFARIPLSRPTRLVLTRQ